MKVIEHVNGAIGNAMVLVDFILQEAGVADPAVATPAQCKRAINTTKEIYLPMGYILGADCN